MESGNFLKMKVILIFVSAILACVGSTTAQNESTTISATTAALTSDLSIMSTGDPTTAVTGTEATTQIIHTTNNSPDGVTLGPTSTDVDLTTDDVTEVDVTDSHPSTTKPSMTTSPGTTTPSMTTSPGDISTQEAASSTTGPEKSTLAEVTSTNQATTPKDISTERWTSTDGNIVSTTSPSMTSTGEDGSTGGKTGGGGLSSGAQAAIAICVILAVLAVGLGGYYIYKRKSGKPYETLDDYGRIEGLQNPTYDVDL